MNSHNLTEISPKKPSFSPQATPDRPRTANSPQTHKRFKTITKSSINALAYSPGASIVYEHARHNSELPSPEAMALANQIWAAENKGLRPDEKFMSFIQDIRKTRKTAKAHVRKNLKTLKISEKIPIEIIMDVPTIATTKEHIEKRRKSAVSFDRASANNTKKLFRQRKIMEIQEKVEQMRYEDSNPDKVVKYLTRVQIDPSVLMQPRFQGNERSAPGSPTVPKSVQGQRLASKVDLNKLVDETKELKIGEGEVFLPGQPRSMTTLRLEQDNEELSKVDIGAVRKYIHISKRSSVSGNNPMTLTNMDGNIKYIQREEEEKERKRLLKIAKGEGRNDDDDVQAPEPIPEFIAQAQAMSLKKQKKVSANDRLKGGISVDELIRKGEQTGIVAEFNLQNQRPLIFSYLRDMYDFASDKGSPKTLKSPLGSPKARSPTVRQEKVPPSQFLSSVFSVRSPNASPEVKNGGEQSPWRGFSTRVVEEKPPEIVQLDQAKHKRTERKELDEREKYLAKIDTFMSPIAIRRNIDTSAKKFYEEKVIDFKRPQTGSMSPRYGSSISQTKNPNVRLDLYNEFQKLTTSCKKNIKSSGRIKRVMRKTFGSLKKNFGKMDMLIEERDVEFERQIKKDIRYDMKNYSPPISALLKMNPSSLGASKVK